MDKRYTTAALPVEIIFLNSSNTKRPKTNKFQGVFAFLLRGSKQRYLIANL